jgi:cytidine deaminase
MDTSTIDWEGLRAAAAAASERAYAPYSGFRVGAAGLADDGRVVTGCNVENASYAVGLCAENGLVSEFVRTGRGRLVAVVTVVTTDKVSAQPVMPCGKCRQILFEHGGTELLIDGDGEIRRLGEILPHAFGPDDLSTMS